MKQLPLESPHYRYMEKSFKEWLETLGYAAQTVYNMPHYVREMLHYMEQQGKIQLQDIDSRDIKDYYQELKYRSNQRRGGGLSNNYLNKHQQAIKKFTEYLRQAGRITLPAINLSAEDPGNEEPQIFTVEEIKELYKASYEYETRRYTEDLGARDRAMLTVFYGCGLRRNEGISLDLSDLNLDKEILHVRKGKNYKERYVPINKANRQYLEDYIYNHRPLFLKSRKEEALFLSQRGKRINGQSMLLRLKLLQERTNNPALQKKEAGLHTLRHSIATHLLNAGMKIESISRFLGHSSLESTQIYTHLTEKANEQH